MPLPIEIGAKASVDIKTEIPKESSGRMLDALVDVIRPFTERQGLKGDLIRLQREDVALEIAKKARKVAEINNVPLHPMPNKILIPILEKGSLEESGSDLVDWWANLLVAGAAEKTIRPFLIDLMTAVGDQEATLLHKLWGAFSGHFSNADPILTDPTFAVGYITSMVKPKIDALLPGLFADSNNRPIVDGAKSSELGREMSALSGWGDQIGVPIELSVPIYVGIGVATMSQKSLLLESAGPAVDVCKALNILREHTHFEPVPGLIGVQARYDTRMLLFTKLGVEFMRACQPRYPSESPSVTQV